MPKEENQCSNIDLTKNFDLDANTSSPKITSKLISPLLMLFSSILKTSAYIKPAPQSIPNKPKRPRYRPGYCVVS